MILLGNVFIVAKSWAQSVADLQVVPSARLDLILKPFQYADVHGSTADMARAYLKRFMMIWTQGERRVLHH